MFNYLLEKYSDKYNKKAIASIVWSHSIEFGGLVLGGNVSIGLWKTTLDFGVDV